MPTACGELATRAACFTRHASGLQLVTPRQIGSARSTFSDRTDREELSTQSAASGFRTHQHWTPNSFRVRFTDVEVVVTILFSGNDDAVASRFASQHGVSTRQWPEHHDALRSLQANNIASGELLAGSVFQIASRNTTQCEVKHHRRDLRGTRLVSQVI